MTEEDWLDRAHPLDMLDYVAASTSGRKLRLFAAACCGALGRTDAADACERVADGRATVEVLTEAFTAAEAAVKDIATANAYGVSTWDSAWGPAASAAAWKVRSRAADRRFRVALIHCVFGNPFRPPSPLAPAVLAWNDGTVRRLAQAIYDARAFDRLPLLADALLDAGCDSEEILAHCRSAGPHAHGCWAVDLILGKT